MTHRYSHITQNRRVGQVALQTAHGQFLGEELKDGIGDAQVALAILEIDGVHLVGHGAGTNLAGLDFLLEILHGDIHPEVAVEVDDNGVDATETIKDGAQPVVVADLGGILFALQAELLTDKTVAEGFPVIFGIGHVVGIVVAGGTAELGCDRNGLQSFELLLQTIDKHHHLLAQTGGRSGLTVGLGEHGHVFPLFCVGTQLPDELFDKRYVYLVYRLLDAQRNTGIVDILGSETEMDKLLVGFEITNLVEFFLDVILHSLYIMVGHLFNLLYPTGTCLIELAVDVTQTVKERMVE